MDSWLAAVHMELSMRRAHSHQIIKGVTERSPKQIMDELREEDPEAAMLLGEFIVTEEASDEGAK